MKGLKAMESWRKRREERQVEWAQSNTKRSFYLARYT